MTSKKKLNTKHDSNNSLENGDTNELNKLVKKTKQQDKVLKKIIKEIKKKMNKNIVK